MMRVWSACGLIFVGLAKVPAHMMRTRRERRCANRDRLFNRHYPGLEVTLAGFSFGSRVGLEVGISDARVVRLIGLGVPVSLYDVSFLQQCQKPILFVHGDHDEFGNVEDLKTLISKIPDETLVQLVVVKDADHFFAGIWTR